MSAALLAGLMAVGFCGCETTQEKSAALERQAKHTTVVQHGVSVGKENPSVKVLGSTVVHSSEGTAVAIALRNTSAHTLADAPIELTVRDSKGGVLYQNNAPGLQASLTEAPLLEPGKTVVWVDDQVQVAGTPARASALVGEGKTASSTPQIEVGSARSSTAGGEASESGSVANRSAVTQENLVVYAIARRDGKTVAAGRAVLPEVAQGTSVPFQIYFVGDPKGAKIEVSAPATTS
ncbi:MAG: hypothetical protein WB998_00255 [Solirubrobacteraceae bacterium]